MLRLQEIGQIFTRSNNCLNTTESIRLDGNLMPKFAISTPVFPRNDEHGQNKTFLFFLIGTKFAHKIYERFGF